MFCRTFKNCYNVSKGRKMLGAIIGDLAGSIFEFKQASHLSNIKIKKIIDKNAFFSDDTILTVAVADAIINKKDYEKTLKEYALKYDDKIPTGIPYFKTMFSPDFMRWVNGNADGKSAGNGAMMRISPVGNFFKTEEEVKDNARLCTATSHNSAEAIFCATTVALIIFYAKQGLTKHEIFDKLKLEIKKPNLTHFNLTCFETIEVCLFALFESNSFEEAIKNVIFFGGDTDTNACIVGSMAEALFGIDDSLIRQAKSKLPKEFNDIIDKFYAITDKH